MAIRWRVKVQDTAQSGNGGGVGGIHAKIGERAGSQVFAFAKRGIRGIVHDAEIKRQIVEIDNFIMGVALGAEHFIDGREVRAGFHLDIGIAFTVENIHVLGILQEGTQHGDGFLIIEHRAIDQIRSHICGCKTIGNQIRILGVLIVDHIGDHDIANDTIEGGGFSQDIYAQNIPGMFSNFAEDIIRGHPKRIINIENEGITLGEKIKIALTEASIHPLGVELREIDDLHIDIEIVLAIHTDDTAFFFMLVAYSPETVAFGGLHIFFEQIVQKIFLA